MRENSEKNIKKYFKKKYNLELIRADYQEVSQSLFYLGKEIYRSLELKYKSGSNNN